MTTMESKSLDFEIQRRESLTPVLGFKLITHTPDGYQMRRVGRVCFDLLTQAADVDRHRAGVDVLRAAPDALQQLFTGKDLFWMPRQQIEHVKFFEGQFDRHVFDGDDSTARMDAQCIEG